jgi:hypothetical protein
MAKTSMTAIATIILMCAGNALAQTQQALTPPPNQLSKTTCPDWQNQQGALRLKVDHTENGDARDQLVTNLNEVEYHLRVDCFGQ